jgi:His/Glu/Gln/Arg/opine family amino acid ABC transporter permease subunit
MSYHWNWGVLLSPVSTGEPTTYLGWLISGFWVTITVSLAAWVIALVVGSLFGILRTVPNRTLAGIGTVYVAIFRNIPLIVQFFVWYLVIPELLRRRSSVSGFSPARAYASRCARASTHCRADSATRVSRWASRNGRRIVTC